MATTILSKEWKRQLEREWQGFAAFFKIATQVLAWGVDNEKVTL